MREDPKDDLIKKEPEDTKIIYVSDDADNEEYKESDGSKRIGRMQRHVMKLEDNEDSESHYKNSKLQRKIKCAKRTIKYEKRHKKVLQLLSIQNIYFPNMSTNLA